MGALNRGRRWGGAVLAAALLAMVLPAGAAAQERDAPVTDEALARFARAYVEIGKVRDRIHAELAQTRNKTAEDQERLRRSLREEVAKVVVAHEMTQEEYGRITWLVSVDAGRREVLDSLLAQLTSSGGGG